MDPLSLNTLLICFGGGILGGILGGLFSFVLCGLFVFAGCLIVLAGGSDFMITYVGFGPIWGPHVGGFAAGVAASTYAAGIRKNHPTEAAKDILASMMPTSWDVYLVGGAFAIFGHLLNYGLGQFLSGQDTIAITVATSGIVARLLFLKEGPFGDPASIKKHGLLGTDNYAISWVPWMLPFSRMVVFAAGVGLLSGGIAFGVGEYAAKVGLTDGAVTTVQIVFGWSFAAMSLIALHLARDAAQQVPVWHCQAILSAIAFVKFGNLGAAVAAAIMGALLQELGARLFWNHGNNHIDPPAVGIAAGTCILSILA